MHTNFHWLLLLCFPAAVLPAAVSSIVVKLIPALVDWFPLAAAVIVSLAVVAIAVLSVVINCCFIHYCQPASCCCRLIFACCCYYYSSCCCFYCCFVPHCCRCWLVFCSSSNGCASILACCWCIVPAAVIPADVLSIVVNLCLSHCLCCLLLLKVLFLNLPKNLQHVCSKAVPAHFVFLRNTNCKGSFFIVLVTRGIFSHTSRPWWHQIHDRCSLLHFWNRPWYLVPGSHYEYAGTSDTYI